MVGGALDFFFFLFSFSISLSLSISSGITELNFIILLYNSTNKNSVKKTIKKDVFLSNIKSQKLSHLVVAQDDAFSKPNDQKRKLMLIET